MKHKEANAKLEASLKEIEEKRITKIVKLLLRGERAEIVVSESTKNLEEFDAELVSTKSRWQS